MAMVKKLARHGNSLALVLDRPILEMLGIDASTSLQITTDGQMLFVAPVRDEHRAQRFQESMDSVNKRYKRTLKRLAE